MSSVIKATDRNRGVHGVAFNLDDLADKANAYLDKVRAEARELLAQASRDADQTRRQAEAEGKRAAELAAEKGIDGRVASQMQTLMPALKLAIEQIGQSKQAWLAHWEQQAIGLAARMAERLVRRELSIDPPPTIAWAREALEMAAGQADVRLLLHPEDHAALGSRTEALAREIARLGAVQILADPAVSRGGCRVETRYGTIDQTVEAQLARLMEDLS